MIKVPADLVLGGGFLLACTQTLFCSILTWQREDTLWSLFLFLKRHQFNHGSPTLTTSSNHNHLSKTPPPKTIPWGVRASTHEFEGNTNILPMMNNEWYYQDTETNPEREMEEPQFTLLSGMELGQWYYNIKTHQLWIVFYSKHTISGVSLSDLEQEHAESHTRENF